VRRFRFNHLFLGNFEWAKGCRDALDRQIIGGGTVLVSGPCGSGKSSLVAAILREYFFESRMVIIETFEELSGISPSFINMVARPPNLSGSGGICSAWLFKEALRIRPDGLVIGEIRGAEAAPFLSASASGHAGCLATVHAGSCESAVARLIGLSAPLVREPFQGLVVQLARSSHGARPAVVGSQVFKGYN
jgi:pilus assembly protein CpaF